VDKIFSVPCVFFQYFIASPQWVLFESGKKLGMEDWTYKNTTNVNVIK
jgi:hypothetical protein